MASQKVSADTVLVQATTAEEFRHTGLHVFTVLPRLRQEISGRLVHVVKTQIIKTGER